MFTTVLCSIFVEENNKPFKKHFIMKNLITTFKTTGKVNTHYFNGYGFTNKTKEVKEKLESTGLVNGVDFEIKNIMGQNTRTQTIKL